MEKSDLKIGLAFSGGGFRASLFSLGVLSYLNSIFIGDETFLKKVIALSTVSGGTITGARYAVGIKQKENFEEIYKSLYYFITQVDLINAGLEKLYSEQNWGDQRIRSLINAFSDVYDDQLFKKAKFGILLTDNDPIHLKHISFNATEFSNGLQFRFQRTEKILKPHKDEPERGYIGNNYYRIPEKIAKEIRMSDILAASSCFPGGFEPINFPSDFKLSDNENIEEISNWTNLPVGLMDGGIVDNQGIEPLLLAEVRMKRNLANELSSYQDSNVFDLLIISDVTSPYMEEFKASKQKPMNLWRSTSPHFVFSVSLIVLILFLCSLAYSIFISNIFLTVLLSFLATLCIISIILLGLGKFIIQRNKFFISFKKSLTKIFRLKFIVFENFLMNRTKSLLKMTNDVFLKHIRRLNYEKIWGDSSWENRRIMNAIYELRPGEKKLKTKIEKGEISNNLIPTKELQAIALKASKMKTTLWFTEDELKNNLPNSLIACGQFNICWNLLEYIEKLKGNVSNINENHKKILACESQLIAHWEQFNSDPLWMVNDINTKLKIT